jgi:hypothetical protein
MLSFVNICWNKGNPIYRKCGGGTNHKNRQSTDACPAIASSEANAYC